MIDNVLVEAELVEIGLEKEEQKDHKPHKENVSKIEYHCKESLQRCFPLGDILEIELICLEIPLERAFKLDSLFLELCQLMHSVILSDFPLLRLPFFHKVGGPEDIDKGIDEDEEVVEASQRAGSD